MEILRVTTLSAVLNINEHTWRGCSHIRCVESRWLTDLMPTVFMEFIMKTMKTIRQIGKAIGFTPRRLERPHISKFV